jgi:hypothetical protein
LSEKKLPDLLIIGAGASGLLAAITAARRGRLVTLVEKNEKIGRKLLATGNGRCNFTNQNMDASFFLTDDAHSLQQILNQWSNLELLDFFAQLGLKPQIDRFGRVLPITGDATTVHRLLYNQLRNLNITLLTSTEVLEVKHQKGLFVIKCQNTTLTSQKLLIATGGAAYPSLGSDGVGYKFAKQLGHSILPPKPALVPLELSPHPFFKLQGIRMDAALTVSCANQILLRRVGEIQFTRYGLSGPATLDASIYIHGSKGKYNSLTLDLLPMEQVGTKADFLERFQLLSPQTKLIDSFIGLLPLKIVEKLLPTMLTNNGFSPQQPLGKLSRESLVKLHFVLSAISLTPSATKSFTEAQTNTGGVPLAEVTSNNLQSKICPNLYLSGELLNVTGHTGGYNLQFAFSTGTLIGKDC